MNWAATGTLVRKLSGSKISKYVVSATYDAKYRSHISQTTTSRTTTHNQNIRQTVLAFRLFCAARNCVYVSLYFRAICLRKPSRLHIPPHNGTIHSSRRGKFSSGTGCENHPCLASANWSQKRKRH